MVAYLNVTLMIISIFMFGALYIYSVLPAHLERKAGNKAYHRCGSVRKISFVFLFVFVFCEIVYVFFPIDISIPRYFFPGWYWLISVVIGGMISVPASLIMNAAAKAAKSESYSPDRKNQMYGGIYRFIRHPQMIGDILYWFAIVFFLNSPFLLLINIIWIPVNIVMMFAEEKDLELRYGEAYALYKNRTPMLIPKKISQQ